MGTPAASIASLATGAGYGEAGDAPFQGPAQPQIDNETRAVSPKPANLPINEETAHEASADDAAIADAETAIPGAVVALAAGQSRKADGLVTVRPKPEKRKSAKERAKEKAKGKAAVAGDQDGTTPTTAKAKSGVAAKAEKKAEKKAEARAKKGKAARKAA